MFRRALFCTILAVLATMLSISQTQAQSCPFGGTLIVASADETTGPGQIMGGTYLDTHTSNNVREAFNETLSNGVSRLYHSWRFDNVPPGLISIYREGYRLGSADNDNFKFGAYYDTSSGPYFIFGAFCTISSETEGTQQCSFNHETYDTATWHVTLQDTVQSSGTALSAVAIDKLVLCSEPEQCNPPPGEFCE